MDILTANEARKIMHNHIKVKFRDLFQLIKEKAEHGESYTYLNCIYMNSDERRYFQNELGYVLTMNFHITDNESSPLIEYIYWRQ